LIYLPYLIVLSFQAFWKGMHIVAFYLGWPGWSSVAFVMQNSNNYFEQFLQFKMCLSVR
jgi:hypothetical protein